MRMLKNELVAMKEVQRWGYSLETLDHSSDEDVEDEANVLGDEEKGPEGKILKALSGHHNLVIFHDVCEDDNNVYIIMEYYLIPYISVNLFFSSHLTRIFQIQEEDANLILKYCQKI